MAPDASRRAGACCGWVLVFRCQASFCWRSCCKRSVVRGRGAAAMQGGRPRSCRRARKRGRERVQRAPNNRSGNRKRQVRRPTPGGGEGPPPAPPPPSSRALLLHLGARVVSGAPRGSPPARPLARCPRCCSHCAAGSPRHRCCTRILGYRVFMATGAGGSWRGVAAASIRALAGSPRARQALGAPTAAAAAVSWCSFIASAQLEGSAIPGAVLPRGRGSNRRATAQRRAAGPAALSRTPPARSILGGARRPPKLEPSAGAGRPREGGAEWGRARWCCSSAPPPAASGSERWRRLRAAARGSPPRERPESPFAQLPPAPGPPWNATPLPTAQRYSGPMAGPAAGGTALSLPGAPPAWAATSHPSQQPLWGHAPALPRRGLACPLSTAPPLPAPAATAL
jgi:hypothetical protein